MCRSTNTDEITANSITSTRCTALKRGVSLDLYWTVLDEAPVATYSTVCIPHYHKRITILFMFD